MMHRILTRGLSQLVAVRPFVTSSAPAGGTPLYQLREPNEPVVVTKELPGPVAIELKNQLNQIQQSSGVLMFVDYEKSIGNFMSGDVTFLYHSFPV